MGDWYILYDTKLLLIIKIKVIKLYKIEVSMQKQQQTELVRLDNCSCRRSVSNRRRLSPSNERCEGISSYQGAVFTEGRKLRFSRVNRVYKGNNRAGFLFWAGVGSLARVRSVIRE